MCRTLSHNGDGLMWERHNSDRRELVRYHSYCVEIVIGMRGSGRLYDSIGTTPTLAYEKSDGDAVICISSKLCVNVVRYIFTVAQFLNFWIVSVYNPYIISVC